MKLSVNPKLREAVVTLDSKVYRREAVRSAAVVFSDKAKFFVEREGKGSIEVALRARKEASPAELRELAGEFLNEALNQDLRLTLARENAGILKLITAQTLYAARGAERPPSLDAETENKLQEEGDRLLAEARAGVP